MSSKYTVLSNEAIEKLCSLVRESHSVAEAIDDSGAISTESTYSSKRINELIENAGVQTTELTWAEYQALSVEERNNGNFYLITDIDSEGVITGYTGGTGITVGEDKIIAIKDIKKNYIDNSNFRINQTGQTEYTVTDSTIYTVDRWYIDGGTLTIVENGVRFVNPNTEAGSSSLVRLKQNIGYTFEDFAGKTLTLSAKINDAIYTGTATIPTEKPIEGTAVQYIASGVADFGINLNYSITGDYFVPYLALAYNRTVTVEWMKLEVNDEFSGYIEPDYKTELIKINMTTNDKGALSLPYTKVEVDNKIPSFTPVLLKVITYDTLSTAKDEAVLVEGIPWSQYEMLIITIGQYYNVQGSTTISTPYFNTTSSGTRPILSFYTLASDGTISTVYSAQVYKNDDNSVYVKTGVNLASEERVAIYGVIKKV